MESGMKEALREIQKLEDMIKQQYADGLYTDEEYQAEMKLIENQRQSLTEYSSRGGAREGAGRPAIGVTKKVSITLDESVWKEIEYISANFDMSKSEVFRRVMESGLNQLVDQLHEQYAKKNVRS